MLDRTGPDPDRTKYLLLCSAAAAADFFSFLPNNKYLISLLFFSSAASILYRKTKFWDEKYLYWMGRCPWVVNGHQA
jgi:hypothetical protein